jgi:hypothetical protein
MSDERTEGLPVLPHLASEFYAWLWYRSEKDGARFDLGGDVGVVDVWVDERLAFRRPGDTKVSAILTGDDASTTLEARAALAGGKVLEEVRLRVRRDDREFAVTLKGAGVSLQRAKLPDSNEKDDTALYDRMFLYEELHLVVTALFRVFSEARLQPGWEAEVVPKVKAWIRGQVQA